MQSLICADICQRPGGCLVYFDLLWWSWGATLPLICPIVKDRTVIWSHSLLSIYLQHQHLFLVMFGLLCPPPLANWWQLFFIFKFAPAPFNWRLWESLSSWKATGNGRAHQIRLSSPPVWISDTHFLHLRCLCLQHAASSQPFFCFCRSAGWILPPGVAFKVANFLNDER